MDIKSISASDFQNRAGYFLDQAAKAPIYITRYNRPVRVLVDVEEYERLKRYDTRESLYPYELSQEMKEELDKGYQGRTTPELDHLME